MNLCENKRFYVDVACTLKGSVFAKASPDKRTTNATRKKDSA